MNKLLFPVFAAAALAAGASQAQDWTIKAGVLHYAPDSRTTGISGVGVPPGADATVGSATTAVITVERHFDANWGVELAFGIPPRVKARGAGSVAFLGDDVLSAKNYGPTFLVNYHFGERGAALRPYAGLGVNYTQFKGVRSKLAPEVYMTDSFGLAAHLGLDWTASQRWGLFASVARIDVKSHVTAVGSTVLQSSIDFRPWTYSAGLWFRF